MVARNYESPEDDDAGNTYEVTVKATDADDNSAMVSIKVTVTDVEEHATLSITGLADASVEENAPWTSPVPTLTGTPIGEVTWTKEGADAADFTINASTGALSMVARNYESPEDDDAGNTYEVTVKATDADDNSAMVSIKVTVTDVQEHATLSITGLADASVEENAPWTSPVPTLTGTPIGEVTWTKEGADAGLLHQRLDFNGGHQRLDRCAVGHGGSDHGVGGRERGGKRAVDYESPGKTSPSTRMTTPTTGTR